jgi:cytochrome c biogenesis protein CcmG/thiol:disulfide interchange protein DsbE
MRKLAALMGGEQSGTTTESRPGAAAAPRGIASRLGMASRGGRIAWAGAAAVVVVIVVVSITGGGTGGRPQPPPAARAFTLKALGRPGSIVSLAEYAGRPVIVNFFASWCPPCKRETPLLARFYRDSRGAVAIIGVDANDDAGPAENFLREAGVTYPVGFDPFPASTTTSYGVSGLPQTFFLNARHRVVKHILGALTMKELTASVALMDGRPAALTGSLGQSQGQREDRG